MSSKSSKFLNLLLSLCFLFFLFFQLRLNNVFALYQTPASWTTIVGNPPIINNDVVSTAIQLVNTVKENCNGTVSLGKIGCIKDKLNFFSYPEKAYNEISSSVNGASNHLYQCVGFVQTVIAGVFGERLDRGGNGKDFAFKIPTGYDFIDSSGIIQPGDLPVFPATANNAYGHIAVAIKSYGNDSFEVGEADGFSGKVDFSLYKRGGYWPLGWLRKKGVTGIPPPEGGPEAIRQAIKDQFAVTMQGAFSEDQLKSTWELFSQSTNTKFPSLVKGAVIKHSIPSDGKYSLAVGCFSGEVTIQMYPFTPGEFFKFILAHELGHRIKACHPRSVAYSQEQEKAYAAERNFSYYGACSGSANEDYAEMITYYLNPKAGLSSSTCGGPKNPSNPFFVEQNNVFIYNGNYPLHYGVAKSVLSK